MKAIVSEMDYDFMECPLCKELQEEIFSLEPDNDDEYDLLEKKFGDISNWYVCYGCIKDIENMLGRNIRIMTGNEEDFDPWHDFDPWKGIPSSTREKMVDATNVHCLKCDGPMEEDEIDYINYSSSSTYMPFKSITLTCSLCKYVKRLEYSGDESVGAIVIGTIEKWDENFIWIKAIEPEEPDKISEGSMDFCISHEEDGFIFRHDLDPEVLKAYNFLNEEVELLIIDKKVVRITG